MKDKPLQQEFASLAKHLDSGGMPTAARMLHAAIGDRSLSDHERWDRQRQQVQDVVTEALAAGIHTEPQTQLELPLDELRRVQDLPPQDLGNVPNAAASEIAALEAAGAIRKEGRRFVTESPARFLNGLVSLAAGKQIWLNVEKQYKKTGLYDQVIRPAERVLLEGSSYDKLLLLLCQASRIYGVSVHAIDVEHVYKTAAEFVTNAGKTGTAMTLSTSSGVIDPLERAGTDNVLKTLHASPNGEIAKKLAKKHAWRKFNFQYGLLNPNLPESRTYYFDRGVTGKAIQATLSLLPPDAQDTYLELAARHLVEALDCPNFKLYEVPRFEHWMWRYTRSSPNHAMISLRHKDTKAIAEGIELRFKDRKKLNRWLQLSLRCAGVAACWSPIATMVILAAGIADDALVDRVKKHVLRPDAEEEARKEGTPVLLHAHSAEDRCAEAKQYIRGLLN